MRIFRLKFRIVHCLQGDFPVEIPEEGVALEEIVKEYIRVALTQTGGNQTKAAELLGISRRRLQNRMQNYGFSSRDFKD